MFNVKRLVVCLGIMFGIGLDASASYSVNIFIAIPFCNICSIGSMLFVFYLCMFVSCVRVCGWRYMLEAQAAAAAAASKKHINE